MSLLQHNSQTQEQRKRFLQACVQNLDGNRSVPQSLKLLRSIIATYPQTHKSWFSRDRENVWGIIESLQQRRGARLLDSFFTDLQCVACGLAWHRHQCVARGVVHAAGWRRAVRSA